MKTFFRLMLWFIGIWAESKTFSSCNVAALQQRRLSTIISTRYLSAFSLLTFSVNLNKSVLDWSSSSCYQHFSAGALRTQQSGDEQLSHLPRAGWCHLWCPTVTEIRCCELGRPAPPHRFCPPQAHHPCNMKPWSTRCWTQGLFEMCRLPTAGHHHSVCKQPTEICRGNLMQGGGVYGVWPPSFVFRTPP